MILGYTEQLRRSPAYCLPPGQIVRTYVQQFVREIRDRFSDKDDHRLRPVVVVGSVMATSSVGQREKKKIYFE